GALMRRSLALGVATVILVAWVAVFAMSPASTRWWVALVLVASAGLTFAQLLRHRRARRPAPPAAGKAAETTTVRDYVVPLAPPPSALLVGRDDELDAIRAALHRPDPGGPRAVTIWGPPGIGKTALAITA